MGNVPFEMVCLDTFKYFIHIENRKEGIRSVSPTTNINRFILKKNILFKILCIFLIPVPTYIPRISEFVFIHTCFCFIISMQLQIIYTILINTYIYINCIQNLLNTFILKNVYQTFLLKKPLNLFFLKIGFKKLLY